MDGAAAVASVNASVDAVDTATTSSTTSGAADSAASATALVVDVVTSALHQESRRKRDIQHLVYVISNRTCCQANHWPGINQILAKSPSTAPTAFIALMWLRNGHWLSPTEPISH